MVPYPQDHFDGGLALARILGLTPKVFAAATGRRRFGRRAEEKRPTVWLCGMALKVLRQERSVREEGRQYTPAELDYFWERLQELGPQLKPTLVRAPRCRMDDGQDRDDLLEVIPSKSCRRASSCTRAPIRDNLQV